MGNNRTQDIFYLVAFDTSANSNFLSDNYGSTPLVLMVQFAFFSWFWFLVTLELLLCSL